jgi:hypothetical protein
MHAKSVSVLGIIAIAGSAALYQGSDWWERAYATYDSSEMSPDGCIRIDTYDPFWVLPSVFHRIPDADPSIRYPLGRPWITPTFKRAYEASTGAQLGETIVFDPSLATDVIAWGRASKPGRRIVEANGFPLVDSSRCSDEATLAKLETYYERQREANRTLQVNREK